MQVLVRQGINVDRQRLTTKPLGVSGNMSAATDAHVRRYNQVSGCVQRQGPNTRCRSNAVFGTCSGACVPLQLALDQSTEAWPNLSAAAAASLLFRLEPQQAKLNTQAQRDTTLAYISTRHVICLMLLFRSRGKIWSDSTEPSVPVWSCRHAQCVRQHLPSSVHAMLCCHVIAVGLRVSI